MKESIKQVIRDLEKERSIRILYACESGSRAWGFASPDSDYDIRFVYAHEKNWYLGLEEKKDFIDLFLPGDLDLSGWDLAKTLRLFAGCNLSLNEWLGSPELYYEKGSFREELASLIPNYFNPRKALHHYLSMAGKVYEKHQSEGQIGIKKLFYVVRPLFCCAWILKNKSMPPTAFQAMLDSELATKEIVSEIESIRLQKESALEGHQITIPPNLMSWIARELQDIEKIAGNMSGASKRNWQELDHFLLNWVS
ncbi:MAG: nucleotidyltransferase domain-containing protein [Verrucomicrobiales bacterium]|nr:nucleotidyltransferase domain-containing protein [Verrucomicrobiales bacterium]